MGRGGRLVRVGVGVKRKKEQLTVDMQTALLTFHASSTFMTFGSAMLNISSAVAGQRDEVPLCRVCCYFCFVVVVVFVCCCCSGFGFVVVFVFGLFLLLWVLFVVAVVVIGFVFVLLLLLLFLFQFTEFSKISR